MVNPMMGLSPEQAAQAKQVGKAVEVVFIKRRHRGEFTMQIKAKSPNVDVPSIVDNLVQQFGAQLYNYFGIGGKVIEIE